MQKEELSCGVPGLIACQIGTDDPSSNNDAAELFAIKGTVAHLECVVTNLMDGVVDEQHWLVAAQVVRAFVQTDYWDETKNLFLPAESSPPYMTFFGSQTLGYVTPR